MSSVVPHFQRQRHSHRRPTFAHPKDELYHPDISFVDKESFAGMISSSVHSGGSICTRCDGYWVNRLSVLLLDET
ncbi:MAG TPA: hypothetical protein DDX19_00855 [Rhodopirellula baltica]|uniref:Uncharacterized protein n=2 Tax=Rhodopirellula baltica TaxID=265606 RepID=Q7URG1_RHOBA|nr:hypothetical protein RBWH47_02695 [Rhodopirellula baltica WH47]CAD74379.1 hypothetical protein RB5693 [Rhodopirellula baltica SH 1]HBE61325.1 hypothetical protein [Rhodopirellula baltica]